MVIHWNKSLLPACCVAVPHLLLATSASELLQSYSMWRRRKIVRYVWYTGLLYKQYLSFAHWVIKIVATFLRRFQVAVDSALSKGWPISTNVPQGSCLSPVCYSCYTDDVQSPMACNLRYTPLRVKLSIYKAYIHTCLVNHRSPHWTRPGCK